MAGNSNPNLFTGQIPTAMQWNSYFSAKQDYPVAGPQTGIVAGTPVSSTYNVRVIQ